MKQEYRHERTSVSLVNYHFCWIVRRRRRVLAGSIKQRLEVLIHDVARELDCEVLTLAIEPEHVHLFINCPPDMAPSDVMHRIKGRTARFLRKEFPELMKLPKACHQLATHPVPVVNSGCQARSSFIAVKALL